MTFLDDCLRLQDQRRDAIAELPHLFDYLLKVACDGSFLLTIVAVETYAGINSTAAGREGNSLVQ